MVNILLKNGTVVTARKESSVDVLVAEGQIAVIGPELDPPEDTQIVDVAGKLIMPGGVDVHTHLDLTSGPAHVSDGWLGGSLAAAHGGTTTVVEHPAFGPPGCPLTHQLNVYRQNALDSVVDYGLHGVFQHWDEQTAKDLPGLVAEGYASFKGYLTYDGRLDEEKFLQSVKALGAVGGLMTVHAENHAIVSYLGSLYRHQAPHKAMSHPLSRPDYAEALAVETALGLAEAAGDMPLYVVHLSTAKGLAAIRRARAEGRNVWAETCPQYLTLTDECYKGDFDEALKYVMAPTPRKQEDVEALWEALFDGTISTVATDHCSFSWSEKKARAAGDIFRCPGGIPGVETRLPLLYSEGVVKRGLSRSRFVELTATAPAALFGLTGKGDIKVGRDADFIIFNPDAEKVIRAETLHQAVDYTPFESMKVRGWPEAVWLRGKKIVDGEYFMGEPGQGRFIARQPFECSEH